MKFFKKKNNKTVQTVLSHHNIEIPVSIIYENRNGYRVSFTKKGLSIRINIRTARIIQDQHINQCLSWAKKTLSKKPTIAKKYETNIFNNREVNCFDKTYKLSISYSNRKTVGTSVNQNTISLILPNGQQAKKKHISKALAKHYRSFFEQRVEYWAGCFPKPYHTIRLKYNSSNWGSCSSKGNINLSTRLFLCPLPAIDYVIVHELAHLVHHNHSKHFWNEVARVLPDYQLQEQWFKTTGAYLDF